MVSIIDLFILCLFPVTYIHVQRSEIDSTLNPTTHLIVLLLHISNDDAIQGKTCTNLTPNSRDLRRELNLPNMSSSPKSLVFLLSPIAEHIHKGAIEIDLPLHHAMQYIRFLGKIIDPFSVLMPVCLCI